MSKNRWGTWLKRKKCLLFKHEKNNQTLSNDWPTYCHTGIWYEIKCFFSPLILIVLTYIYRFDKIKEFEAPVQINSAALHPDKKVFVSGGEDFKMYKFDYESGDELGKFFKNTLGLNPHMSFAPLYW